MQNIDDLFFAPRHSTRKEALKHNLPPFSNEEYYLEFEERRSCLTGTWQYLKEISQQD